MASDPQVVREWFSAEQQRAVAPLARIVDRVEKDVDKSLGEREGTLSAVLNEDDPRQGWVHATVKVSASIQTELESLEPAQVEVIQAELRRRYLGAGFDALIVHVDRGEVAVGCELTPGLDANVSVAKSRAIVRPLRT